MAITLEQYEAKIRSAKNRIGRAKSERKRAVMLADKLKHEAKVRALEAELRDLRLNFYTLTEDAPLMYSTVTDPAPADPTSDCEKCGCTNGWLHMTDSHGCGPGIERCDECKIFASDEEAASAHAKECDCGLTIAEGR